MADIVSIDSEGSAQARAACRAEMDQRGISIKQASREVGVSNATLSKWLRGIYEGNVPAVTAQVAAWLQTRRENAARSLEAAGLDRFVSTGASAEIADALAYAHATADIVLVHGPSGRSKTRTARHYCATYAGATHMEATGAMARLAGLLGCVAEALGDHQRHSSALASERAIIRNLQGRGALLVIDEADNLRASLLDELRCIRDIAGCGLALIGSEQLRMTVARCPQILGRIGMRVNLRSLAAADVAAIAAGPLGRKPSAAEVRELTRAASRDGGLHTLRRILADAWKLARHEGVDGVDGDCLRTAIESVIDQEGSDADDDAIRKRVAA